MDHWKYTIAFAIMALYYGLTHSRSVREHIAAVKPALQRLTDIRFSRKRLAIVELSERERRVQIMNMVNVSNSQQHMHIGM